LSDNNFTKDDILLLLNTYVLHDAQLMTVLVIVYVGVYIFFLFSFVLLYCIFVYSVNNANIKKSFILNVFRKSNCMCEFTDGGHYDSLIDESESQLLTHIDSRFDTVVRLL